MVEVLLSPKHEKPQTPRKNQPRVTPGLNHNKCCHFSSQTPLELFNFLTNGAWGLSAWTAALPDLSFAGAAYLWKTLHHRVLKPPPKSPCVSMYVLQFPFSLCQFHSFQALQSQPLCIESIPVYSLGTWKETKVKNHLFWNQVTPTSFPWHFLKLWSIGKGPRIIPSYGHRDLGTHLTAKSFSSGFRLPPNTQCAQTWVQSFARW